MCAVFHLFLGCRGLGGRLSWGPRSLLHIVPWHARDAWVRLPKGCACEPPPTPGAMVPGTLLDELGCPPFCSPRAGLCEVREHKCILIRA